MLKYIVMILVSSSISNAQVFKVVNQDGRSSGTGFNIEYKGRIVTVTASHVCKNETGLIAEMDDGSLQVLTLLADNPKSDLCVLTGAVGVNYVTLADRSRINVKAYSVGYPQGTRGSTRGLVVGYSYGIVVKHVVLVYDAPCLPGASGSPLFNYNGQVIGVISIGSTTSGGAIPVEFLKQLLDTIQ